MVYVREIDKARFIKGIIVPKWAKYVKVTKEGAVWRRERPKFYKNKPEGSKEV